MLVEVLAFVVPLLLPIAAIISGAPLRTIVASFVPLALLGVSRLLICLTQRQPLTTLFWHPVTILVALVGQVAGDRRRRHRSARLGRGAARSHRVRPAQDPAERRPAIAYHRRPDRPTRP